MDELELIPYENPDAGEASGIGLLVLLGVGGYLLWCYFSSTYKGLPWSWTPWKQPIGSRIRQLAEHKVRPPSDNTREIVTLIVP